MYGRPASSGFIDARQQPKQRRLARAVVADESHPVAHPQRQGDVTQRFDDDDVVAVAPDGPAGLTQERLLQRPGLRIEDGEFNPGAAGLDIGLGCHCDRLLLQVLPGPVPRRSAGRGDSGRQRRLAHVFQLRPGCHLLGEQRRLYPVEQALEPTDQLRLGDP